MLLICNHVPCRPAKDNVDLSAGERGGGGGAKGAMQRCPADAYDQLKPFRSFSNRHHHRLIPFIAYATDALALGKSFSLLSPHLLSWLHGFAGLGHPDALIWLHDRLAKKCVICTAVWQSCYVCKALCWQQCFDHRKFAQLMQMTHTHCKSPINMPSGTAASKHAQLLMHLQAVLLTCMYHMACNMIM